MPKYNFIKIENQLINLSLVRRVAKVDTWITFEFDDNRTDGFNLGNDCEALFATLTSKLVGTNNLQRFK